MDHNIDGKLAAAVMYIIGLLSSTWIVTMATDSAGCRDAESFLRYRKIEPSTTPYSEPLISTVKATFGMGCFWGVEASFGALPGVVRVKAGYTGGKLEDPNYRRLGDHTEAVEIEFDPTKTSYRELLRVFYQDHDATELYKTQYMSAIFYHDEVQRHQAEASLQAEQKRRGEALEVVTKILPAGKFYPAEDYHQKYFLRQQHALVASLDLKDADFLSSSRTSRLLGYMSGPGTLEAFNAEVENLALSSSQADFMRVLIENKDGGTCH
ncbi:peptide methionine sulfoxide reductase MsrA-like [Lytechinus pictus]|uniref:peptide methionine sulfoxide reductase MsrA-like n=1 Tax=Lytechinus pictus TaxID=7653 RepID=UPI0030BA20A9